jgi:hypothetical protein
MDATPKPTCTKIVSSAATVNHHSARVRSDGALSAPSAHRPASALEQMTIHAQPTWRSRRVRA